MAAIFTDYNPRKHALVHRDFVAAVRRLSRCQKRRGGAGSRAQTKAASRSVRSAEREVARNSSRLAREVGRDSYQSF